MSKNKKRKELEEQDWGYLENAADVFNTGDIVQTEKYLLAISSDFERRELVEYFLGHLHSDRQFAISGNRLPVSWTGENDVKAIGRFILAGHKGLGIAKDDLELLFYIPNEQIQIHQNIDVNAIEKALSFILPPNIRGKDRPLCSFDPNILPEHAYRLIRFYYENQTQTDEVRNNYQNALKELLKVNDDILKAKISFRLFVSYYQKARVTGEQFDLDEAIKYGYSFYNSQSYNGRKFEKLTESYNYVKNFNENNIQYTKLIEKGWITLKNILNFILRSERKNYIQRQLEKDSNKENLLSKPKKGEYGGYQVFFPEVNNKESYQKHYDPINGIVHVNSFFNHRKKFDPRIHFNLPEIRRTIIEHSAQLRIKK